MARGGGEAEAWHRGGTGTGVPPQISPLPQIAKRKIEKQKPEKFLKIRQ
jgi:hypothetical protein